MSHTKQNARILDAAMRDNRLHKLARPVDVTDANAFPNIAQAERELAAMPPEKLAQLQAEWAEGGVL